MTTQTATTGSTIRQPKISPSWNEINRLKLVTTLTPALAIFLFEIVRHEYLRDSIPALEGNLLIGLFAMALSFGFTQAVFSKIKRLHHQALTSETELVGLNAVVQERERLSRELHDGLAQVVSYLMVRLDTVNQLISAGRPEEAKGELDALREVADELYLDVRESISGLRSSVVELGLVPALREYLGEFEERTDIAVRLDAPNGMELPMSASLQLFRIVQEALANVRKHSGATEAHVQIKYIMIDRVELVVEDNGAGFHACQQLDGSPKSFGLTSMRERSEALGGSCEVISSPSGGTTIVVEVPIPHHERSPELAPAAG